MIPNNEVRPGRERDHDVVDRALRQSQHNRAPLTIQPAPIPRRFHTRKSIYRYCIARVIQRLAPRWSGHTQSLRRAVRNFLMPRRRNLRALAGILHASKTAAAAAALILLLAAPAAVADERLPVLNIRPATLPAGMADIGKDSAPALADFDGDGDLDLLVGKYPGTFSYFVNTGSATAPAYTSTTTPTGLTVVEFEKFESIPAVGDLDGDGDLDVLAGDVGGVFAFFENTGSPLEPAFVSTTTPAGLPDIGYHSAPALGDLDGDGDLDLLVGENLGTFVYFQNTGSATSPAFASTTSPTGLTDVGRNSTPALGDVDGDGDLDILTGEEFGTLLYLQNTGSKTTPAFAPPVLCLSDLGTYSRPTLGDIDGDGDLDVLAGSSAGDFNYFEHHAFPKPPEYISTTSPTGAIDVGYNSTPALGDIDGDGDADILAGDVNGAFHYLLNTGTATAPAYTTTTAPAGLTNIGLFNSPSLGDLDGDGDLDLISGRYDGIFVYFVNTGSKTSPAFVSTAPAGLIDIGSSSSPSIGDLDGDGDLDLIAGRSDGTFVYFVNTGSKTSPAFVSTTMPTGLTDVGTYSSPSFTDLDGDGDLDLISGRSDGTFLYFENTGSANAPAFASSTSPLNDLGYYSSPSLADFDGDGDLDLLAGAGNGAFFYFENTAPTPHPAYLSTDFPGPAVDVGYLSAPTFADLDGDGDQDLVLGASDGNFPYFVNTGTPSVPAFASTTTPAGLVDIGDGSAPAVADLDGDGDLDVLTGTLSGEFIYFQNTGSADAPAFTSTASPVGAVDIGSESTPTLGDLDGDGDLDLLAGESGGGFIYFENTGTPAAPAFASAAIPGTLPDVGNYAQVALADVDSDGDLDVLSGAGDGLFYYYENTGSPTAPALVSTATPAGLVGIGNESAPALADIDADGDLDVLSGDINGTLDYFENVSLKSLPLIDGPERVAVPMSDNASPKAFELTLDASDILGHTITWSIRLQASNGTAAVSGTGTSKAITYTPDTDFTGVDVFIVDITNGHGFVDSATVVVHVFDPDDSQPLANNFTTLDGDSSSGLTLTEAQAQLVGLTALEFATLDIDGNGEITLDELKQAIGNSIIFVDFANNGAEDGTSANPYNTLDEGVANVTSGGTVVISGGSTSTTSTISKSLTLQSTGGKATIGTP